VLCFHFAAKSALGSQVNRHVLVNRQTEETFIKHLTPEQEKDTSHFVDKDTGMPKDVKQNNAMPPRLTPVPRTSTGVELEPQEKLSLLEWLANEYKRFGCQLECVRTAQQSLRCTHRHLVLQVCD